MNYIVAPILERVLRDYIVGLNRTTVSTSVWSGNVNLENICLNAPNLNNDSSLQLPFSITKGTIGSLSLSLDWKTWYVRKHPISIRVSDVLIQCSPREEDDWFQAFGAASSSSEAEDIAREKLQKSIEDIASIKEDPALMAIWAPLFSSIHVELKNVTIAFKDISPKPEKERTEDHDEVKRKHLSEISVHLESLRITNPDDDDAGSRSSEIASTLYNQAASGGFMETRVKSIDITGFRVALDCDCLTPRGWFPEHPFSMITSTARDCLSEGSPTSNLVRVDNTSLLLRISRRKRNRGFAAAIVALNDDGIHLALTPAQLISIAHLESALKVWKKRIEYAFARRPLIKDGKNWKEWWQYAKRAVLRGRRESKKSTTPNRNRQSRKMTEAKSKETSQRLSQIVQDAISASSSSNTSDIEEYDDDDGSSDDTDDDEEYAEEEEIFASLGFKSSSTLTGLHLRRRLKRGLEATAAVATKLSFTTIEHMHQRGQRRRRHKRAKFSKTIQAARIKLHQQIFEDTDCDFQVALPKISVRLKDNFSADTQIELVYNKVYVRMNESGFLDGPTEDNLSDLKVVLQSFSAYVVSGDKMTEILRGNDNHKQASITLETTEGQTKTSLVVAPLKVAIDLVSLELILQFAVNKVPKSSLFANRLSATLFPLCEALKLNMNSRLATVEALLETREYAKEMKISLEGLSVCLVHDETREPILCAGFDRLTSTSGGALDGGNDEIDVLVVRDTYMKELLEAAKEVGDIDSLNELEKLVGTMRSSISVDNLYIGTNVSGDETSILNDWSAAIISEENSVNRTRRLAVQRFDPLSLVISPSDVKSLAMVADVLSRMQMKKMDVSNWCSDKLFKVSAMIAPPNILDARVSLPDIDVTLLDLNRNCKSNDDELDFWLRAKVKGLAFDSASTVVTEELIAWSILKIDSVSVLCESNTIAAVSDLSLSRAERKDENVCIHAGIVGFEVDASFHDLVAKIQKFTSPTTESHSNQGSFSLRSQHAPSSHALNAYVIRWDDLPDRRIVGINEVLPCVDCAARAVLEVTGSKTILTGKLERLSVICSLFERKNAGSIHMNIPGGFELGTVSESSTGEAQLKMNEINLAFATENGYHQAASISSVNIIFSADFKIFSGKCAMAVPWQVDLGSNVITAHFGASLDLSNGVDVVLDEVYICAGRSNYGVQEAIRISRTSSRILDIKSILIEKREDFDEFEVDIARIDVRLTSTHISIIDSFSKNVISELDRVCKCAATLPSSNKEVDRLLSSLSFVSSPSLIQERNVEESQSRTEYGDGVDMNFVKRLPNSAKFGIRRISVRVDDDRYSVEHPVPVSSMSLMKLHAIFMKRVGKSLESQHVHHKMKEMKVSPLSLSVSFQVCGGTYDTLKRRWEFALEPVELKSSVETGSKSCILTTSPIDFVVRKEMLESLALSIAIVNRRTLRSASRKQDSRLVEPFQCFWLKNSSGVDLSYEMLTNNDTSLGGTCISNGEVAVRYGDSWKDDAYEYLERLAEGDVLPLPESLLEVSSEYGNGRSGTSLFRHPTVTGLKIRLTNAPESRHHLSLDDLESKARKCEALPKSVWGGAEGDLCSLVAEIRFRENAVEQREIVLRSNVVVRNSTLKPVMLSFAGKSTFGPIEAGEFEYLPLSLASLDSFVWKFEGDGPFSTSPDDKISLHSVDSFIPVNARRCAIVISSDEESVTRTIAFVAPLELRNHLPVPVKASFLSGNRKFSSFVVAPRSTAIIEESEDVLDAATLSFVPLGYVCARSSIYIPTFSNLSRRQSPLKVFRHVSPTIRRNVGDRNDEDVATLECSVYLDKYTSSRVLSITCAMTLTNLTTHSLTLKYADLKSNTSGKYSDKLDSLDESSASTIVCPPTPPSKSVNDVGTTGTTEKAFEHTSASDLSSKAVLFTRMHSTSFSSSDLESSFTSTPVRANLSSRFQSPSPNAFGVSSAGVSSHLSRFSSDSSPYALPSSSSGGKILAMKNSTQYPRILGDLRRHRQDSGFALFTLGCEEYASDPFKLAPTSGKFISVHVKPHYCFVITTIYDDSDGGCAHIFVRPKGTITNSTQEIIAFKESDFEESDGIILLPGQTAHVRSKKSGNSVTGNNARGGEKIDEGIEESENIPRVRIRPASSAEERWNWSDDITASTAWCRCSRALSLDRSKDDVHFSVHFNESEEDGCFNIDVIAGELFGNQEDDDINNERAELSGVTDTFQTSPPPIFVVSPLTKDSPSSMIPVSSSLSSPASISSATAVSSSYGRTTPFSVENFEIKVASIGLSALYENTELVNGRICGISVMLSENCKDEEQPVPLVQGYLDVERIEISAPSASIQNESSILLSVPNAEMRMATIGASYYTSASSAITLKLSGSVFSRHVEHSRTRVDIAIAPVRIDLQESLLKKVPGFVAGCVQSLDVSENPELETRLKMERNRKVKSRSSKGIGDSAMFRIDDLCISDVPIVLSFTELPFVPFLFSKLAAVERAKITLSGFKNQKALAFPDEVLKALERHVKNQAAGRVRDLIKHNALLGDPARLVESTRHAVRELGEGNGFKAFARVTSAFGRSGLTTINRIKSIADGWVEEFDSLENERRRAVRDRHILSLPSSSSSANVIDDDVLPLRYSERVIDSVCKAIMDMIQNPITGLECRGLVGMAEGSIFGAVSGISRILAASIEGPLSLVNTFLGE